MNNKAQLQQNKQIIDDQISEIEKSMEISEGVAFLRYVYSVYLILNLIIQILIRLN